MISSQWRKWVCHYVRHPNNWISTLGVSSGEAPFKQQQVQRAAAATGVARISRCGGHTVGQRGRWAAAAAAAAAGGSSQSSLHTLHVETRQLLLQPTLIRPAQPLPPPANSPVLCPLDSGGSPETTAGAPLPTPSELGVVAAVFPPPPAARRRKITCSYSSYFN